MTTRGCHRPLRRTGARSSAATAAEAPTAPAPTAAEQVPAAADTTMTDQVPAAAGTSKAVLDHMASAAWQLETGERQVAEVDLDTKT